MKRAVVAIYIDPDFYPPTINAILNLAEISDDVIVISRNNAVTDYPYPSNVRLRKIGKFSTVRDLEKQSILLKVAYFLRFTFCLYRYAASRKTRLVVLYDSFALFAFYLVKSIRRHKRIWYHNHDMPDKKMTRKYSIGGLAAKYERNAMEFINIFSLPSKERSGYYPGISPKISLFIIPNYPSLKVYNHFKPKENKNKIARLIFQGFIGPGHSLEELLELLPEDIQGYSLQLILKGSVTDQYKSSLIASALRLNVANKLTWMHIGPYSEMPSITSSCDIGIGINMNTDIISKTQGTASNKIYEYAASGLPVILFDSLQFRTYLDKYNWVFFTDGSVNSLKYNIELILRDLQGLGRAARQDFERGLNFEVKFSPALKEITADLHHN